MKPLNDKTIMYYAALLFAVTTFFLRKYSFIQIDTFTILLPCTFMIASNIIIFIIVFIANIPLAAHEFKIQNKMQKKAMMELTYNMHIVNNVMDEYDKIAILCTEAHVKQKDAVKFLKDREKWNKEKW